MLGSLRIELVAPTMVVMVEHPLRLHLIHLAPRFAMEVGLPVFGSVVQVILNRTAVGPIQATAPTQDMVGIQALSLFAYPISFRPRLRQVHQLLPILVGTSGTPSQVPARFRSR